MNTLVRTAIDYEQLVEVIGDAIVVADASGVINVWNPSAERLFGFTQAEALGNSLDLIVPERLRERHWAGYRKTMASGSWKTAPRRIVSVRTRPTYSPKSKSGWIFSGGIICAIP